MHAKHITFTSRLLWLILAGLCLGGAMIYVSFGVGKERPPENHGKYAEQEDKATGRAVSATAEEAMEADGQFETYGLKESHVRSLASLVLVGCGYLYLDQTSKVMRGVVACSGTLCLLDLGMRAYLELDWLFMAWKWVALGFLGCSSVGVVSRYVWEAKPSNILKAIVCACAIYMLVLRWCEPGFEKNMVFPKLSTWINLGTLFYGCVCYLPKKLSDRIWLELVHIGAFTIAAMLLLANAFLVPSDVEVLSFSIPAEWEMSWVLQTFLSAWESCFPWYFPLLVWKLSCNQRIASYLLPPAQNNEDYGTMQKKVEEALWCFGLTTLVMWSAWQLRVQPMTKEALVPRLKLSFLDETQVVKDLMSAFLVSYGIGALQKAPNDDKPLLPQVMVIAWLTTWLGWFLDCELAPPDTWLRTLVHGTFSSGLTAYLLWGDFVDNLKWAVVGYAIAALLQSDGVAEFWNGYIEPKTLYLEEDDYEEENYYEEGDGYEEEDYYQEEDDYEEGDYYEEEDYGEGVCVDLVLLGISIANMWLIYEDVRFDVSQGRGSKSIIESLFMPGLLMLTTLLYPEMKLWATLVGCYASFNRHGYRVSTFATFREQLHCLRWHVLVLAVCFFYSLHYLAYAGRVPYVLIYFEGAIGQWIAAIFRNPPEQQEGLYMLGTTLFFVLLVLKKPVTQQICWYCSGLGLCYFSVWVGWMILGGGSCLVYLFAHYLCGGLVHTRIAEILPEASDWLQSSLWWLALAGLIKCVVRQKPTKSTDDDFALPATRKSMVLVGGLVGAMFWFIFCPFVEQPGTLNLRWIFLSLSVGGLVAFLVDKGVDDLQAWLVANFPRTTCLRSNGDFLLSKVALTFLIAMLSLVVIFSGHLGRFQWLGESVTTCRSQGWDALRNWVISIF